MMQAYLTRNKTHFHGSTPTQETHRNDDLRLSVPDVVVSLVAPSSLPPVYSLFHTTSSSRCRRTPLRQHVSSHSFIVPSLNTDIPLLNSGSHSPSPLTQHPFDPFALHSHCAVTPSLARRARRN